MNSNPTCLLLKTLNFINQLILLLEYIEHHIYILILLLEYIKCASSSIRIPNSTGTTS